MPIQSVKSKRQNMYLPCKCLPLVWCILQSPPFFARKNSRIGTASDSLIHVDRNQSIFSRIICSEKDPADTQYTSSLYTQRHNMCFYYMYTHLIIIINLQRYVCLPYVLMRIGI